MTSKWWFIGVLALTVVFTVVECRRRGHGGHRGFTNGGPPRRIPPWQVDWWLWGWKDDEDGLPPEHPWEHPWDSHDKDDWDESRYPTPSPGGDNVPPEEWASQTCRYTDITGAHIECSTGCCISSRGFGCCEMASTEENKSDNTQLIIYIILGVVGALFVTLVVVVVAWKFCKTTTTPTPTRGPKPKPRPVTAVTPVLPANFEKLRQNQPTPVLPVVNSRSRLPNLYPPSRQPSAPQRSVDQSRQQNGSNQRPPANGSSRYDIFTVGSPTPVLPNYSDVSDTNRPPPEYSVNEPNFGSGYLRSFMSPPPPYSPNSRANSTSQHENRYSRMSYSNV